MRNVSSRLCTPPPPSQHPVLCYDTMCAVFLICISVRKLWLELLQRKQMSWVIKIPPAGWGLRSVNISYFQPVILQSVSSHSQTNCLRSSDNQPLTNTNNSGNTSSQLSSHISDHFVKLYKNIICFTSKYFSILIFECWSLISWQPA